MPDPIPADIVIPKGAIVQIHTGHFNRVIVQGELLPPTMPGTTIDVLEVRPGAKLGGVDGGAGMVMMQQKAKIGKIQFGHGTPIAEGFPKMSIAK